MIQGDAFLCDIPIAASRARISAQPIVIAASKAAFIHVRTQYLFYIRLPPLSAYRLG